MNRDARMKLCWLLCAALLSGCVHGAAARNELPPAPGAVPQGKKEKPVLNRSLVERSIVKGKTTKEELVALLGVPGAVEPNRQRPSAELLAKAKGELPPLAHTKEFWKYWSTPFKSDGSTEGKIFNLLVFLDDRGVAVDYLTADTKVLLP